jgi:hypothetical protein
MSTQIDTGSAAYPNIFLPREAESSAPTGHRYREHLRCG